MHGWQVNDIEAIWYVIFMSTIIWVSCMQAFIPDKEQSVQYTGKLAGNALKKWALQQIPSHVSVVNSEKDLQKLLETCSLNQSPGSSGAGAEWGACALLATDSSDVSALWKSMSSRYRGKVRIQCMCTSVRFYA